MDVDMAEGGQKEENSQNGSCEGSNSMYIKLISSDGHEFIIKREHALMSNTIKSMLSGPGQFAENETNVVNLRGIPSHVLQVICEYLSHKFTHSRTSTKVPSLSIPPEMSFDVLLASNFLDC